jgi:hypothetical protein
MNRIPQFLTEGGTGMHAGLAMASAAGAPGM